MHARPHLVLLIGCFVLGCCLGCANTSKNMGKFGKVFSPVTGVVKGTTGFVRRIGSGMADDTRQYTTKLPGTNRTTITPSQRRAIAQYERKKYFEQHRRKYDLDSSLIPKGAKVYSDQ